MKYLISLVIFLSVFNLALAAPTYTIHRTMLPEASSTYDIGTSSVYWKNGFFSTGNFNVLNATSATVGTLTISSLATSPLIVGGSATTTIYGDGSVSIFGGGLRTASSTYLAVNSGFVGIGTSTPSAMLDVFDDVFPVMRSERSVTATNSFNSTNIFVTRTTGDAADGLGGGIVFAIRDAGISTDTTGLLGSIGAVRDGSDRSGAVVFNVYNNGVFGEKMRISSSGSVGIGTTTPYATLHVIGGSAITGSAGIGTSYTAKLDVTQPSNGWSAALGADISSDSRTDSTRKFTRIGASGFSNSEEPVTFAVIDADGTNNLVSVGGGTSIGNAATAVRFLTAAATTTTSGTERMRIDSSGNVGIGTTTPREKLHILGTAASDYVAGRIENTGANGAADFDFLNDARAWKIGVNTADDFRVRDDTGGANVLTIEDGASANSLYINSSGNTGLGVASPNTKLHVYDPSNANILTVQRGSSTTGSGIGLVFDAVDSGNARQNYAGIFGRIVTNNAGNETGELEFHTATAGSLTEKAVITTAGNFGLGTTTPSQLFEMYTSGSIGPQIKMTSGEAGSRAWALVANASGNLLGAGNFGLYDYGSSTYRMVWMGNNGNVGIGTTTPSKALQVTGAAGSIFLDASGNNLQLGHNRAGTANFIGSTAGAQWAWYVNARTTSSMILNSSGYLGVGTTTPSVQLDTVGYAKFNTSYGEMASYEDAKDTITTTSTGTYYVWRGSSSTMARADGQITTSTTPYATSTFTVGALGDGLYRVGISASMTSSINNTIVHCDVFNNGVDTRNIAFKRKIATGGDVGNANAQGFLTLAQNDVVDLRCDSDQAGAVLTFSQVNFNLFRISR